MKMMLGSGRTGSAMALTLAALSSALLPTGYCPVAHAQAAQESPDVRLRRLEAELRAVQRKVFPDGAGKTFGPEITPPASGAIPPAPTPTAVTDLLTRMDAVESQLQRLTAASEENQNHIAKLESRIATLEAAGAVAPSAAAPAVQPSSAAPSVVGPTPAVEAATSVKSTPKPSVNKPDAVKGEPPLIGLRP